MTKTEKIITTALNFSRLTVEEIEETIRADDFNWKDYKKELLKNPKVRKEYAKLQHGTR